MKQILIETKSKLHFKRGVEKYIFCGDKPVTDALEMD